MDTRTLLTAIISFLVGGLLVSTAAVSFEKERDYGTTDMMSGMQISSQSLHNKSGNDFDKEFIEQMIIHHQGAVEMAKMAEQNAKHDEIKKLAKDIISAQENEITQMRQWQKDWGYPYSSSMHSQMMH